MDNCTNSEIGQSLSDRYSLRGRVFNQIRDSILSGKYAEGEELREVIIGKELGVSRTPVREALRQLELEGLVSIIPNKGAFVTGISMKDIEDIFVIRSYLEGLAAAWACDHITEEQLSELEENVYLSEFHVEKEHYDQVVELDSKFHIILYDSCGSRMLAKQLKNYHQYAERVRTVNLNAKERAKHSMGEHKAIVGAIKAKDKELAQQCAHEHIEESIKRMQFAEDAHMI